MKEGGHRVFFFVVLPNEKRKGTLAELVSHEGKEKRKRNRFMWKRRKKVISISF